MPELPDVTVCIERLQALAGGQVLRRLQLLNPFVLRTAEPPVAQAEGCRLTGVERLASLHQLADRAMSRLLDGDRPKTLDDLAAKKP